MFEVAKGNTRNWVKLNNQYLVPSYVAFNCVNPECGRSFESRIIRKWSMGATNFAWVVETCPWCETQATLFLVDPRASNDEVDRSRLYVYPSPSVGNLPSEILELSPRGAAIIEQARVAEMQGLDQLAGMGYRKALEILVKDFLIREEPEEAEEVIGEWLSVSIRRINDEGLRELARRASWLGNDEAHYTRQWNDKDFYDLRFLVERTIEYIANKLKVDQHIDDMS